LLIIDLVDHLQDLPSYQLSCVSEQDSQITLFAVLMDGPPDEVRGTGGLLGPYLINECDIDKGKLANQFIDVLQHTHLRTVNDHYLKVPILLMQQTLQSIVIVPILQSLMRKGHHHTNRRLLKESAETILIFEVILLPFGHLNEIVVDIADGEGRQL
jgi:hypothetical protein